MASTITDTFNAHLEQVAEKVAVYWQFDNALAGKLAPSTRAKATRYLYRIPIELYVGGTYQKYSADRGDMGTGTGMKLSHLTAGFFDSTFNFEITKEQIDLSKTSEQSRINIMSDTVAKAMQALQAYDNVYLHGDGTGKLTNAASTGTSTTLTFAGASDTLGVNQLFEGMSVDVWDSTGATKRADGPYKITAIDWGAKKITFGSAPTGMATTDLVAVANADVYGPSTLVSFSSTWPGDATTNAAGLTGDSWRHGLRYVNDATTSNYYLGRQKSALTQLIPTRVNAQSAALSFEHAELAKNLTIQRRGPEVLDGVYGVMHMSQMGHLKSLGVTISQWNRTGGEKMIDLQPSTKYNDTYTFADIPCCFSRIQDRARVDFFNPKLWGRVEGHPSEFYNPTGRGYLRELRASNGNTLAGVEFKIVSKFDWVCDDPGAGFYIDTLAVPSGY